MKPSILVGSSSEALPVARAVQANLSLDADVIRWNQSVFPLSSITVHQLIRATRSHDYAVFVLASDDFAIIRGEPHRISRDNVLFELGMALASVGLERTFIVVSSAPPNLRFPSDLAGITIATYDPNSHDGNIRGALGPACTQILDAIGRRHPLSDDWSLFIADSKDDAPNGVMTFVAAGDKVNARLQLTRTPDGTDTMRNFVYQGHYISGQVALTFEQGGAQDQIVGVMALHFRADRLTLQGRTTFWHHDKAKMVTTDFILKRPGA